MEACVFFLFVYVITHTDENSCNILTTLASQLSTCNISKLQQLTSTQKWKIKGNTCRSHTHVPAVMSSKWSPSRRPDRVFKKIKNELPLPPKGKKRSVVYRRSRQNLASLADLFTFSCP